MADSSPPDLTAGIGATPHPSPAPQGGRGISGNDVSQLGSDSNSWLHDPAIRFHLALLAIVFLSQFVLSDYLHLSLTRVMVLAIFASGYNLTYGYAGLLSLGHAMFFAAGLYGAALPMKWLGAPVPLAFVGGIAAGAVLALAVGLVALRTAGVAFMIVTLMFSQALFLTVLYFGDWTRGDEGIVIQDTFRRFELGGLVVDLTSPAIRFNIALALLAACLAFLFGLVRSRFGRILVAIRENEPRAAMLGYDVQRHKLIALVVSGTLSAIAGATYTLMFGYAGSTLASIQYSINPLLWTLLGGAATVTGPFLGTLVMFAVVDVASSFTRANLLAVGVVLVAAILFFPKGIMGTVRERWLRWLP